MKNPDELTPATILALAQEKIRNRKHWCSGHLATDGHLAVDPCGPEAKHWCAAGALILIAMTRRQGYSGYSGPEFEALEAAAVQLFGRGFMWVNDHLGHHKIMRVFDRAIANTQGAT
jgi:hypothetical protein